MSVYYILFLFMLFCHNMSYLTNTHKIHICMYFYSDDDSNGFVRMIQRELYWTLSV